MGIPDIELPVCGVSTRLYLRSIIVSLWFIIFQAANRAARVKSAGKARNAQDAIKSKQPASTNKTNVNINLEAVPTTTFVFLACCLIDKF